MSIMILLSFAVLRQLCYLCYHNEEAVLQMEEAAASRDMIEWKPPPKEVLDKLLIPYKWLMSPQFYGLDNIPSKGERILFVSNHALLGLEMPLLIEGVYRQKGIFMRGLGGTLDG